MPNNTNNPITEAALIIISVALIAAMTILFVLGKIDYVEAIPFLTVVAGLWGVSTALKAPSPSQQAQIGAQQQSLQDVISQLMNVLPVLKLWGYNEYTYCAAIAQARKEQGLRREPCSCVLGDGLLIHNL